MPTHTIEKQNLHAPILSLPIASDHSVETVVAQCELGIIGSVDCARDSNSESFANDLERLTVALNAKFSAKPYSQPVAYAVCIHDLHDPVIIGKRIGACAEFEVPIAIVSGIDVFNAARVLQRHGCCLIQEVSTLSDILAAKNSGADGLLIHMDKILKSLHGSNVFGVLQTIRSDYDGLLIITGVAYSGSHALSLQVAGADLVCLKDRLSRSTSFGISASLLNEHATHCASSTKSICFSESFDHILKAQRDVEQTKSLVREIIDEYETAYCKIKRRPSKPDMKLSVFA